MMKRQSYSVSRRLDRERARQRARQAMFDSPDVIMLAAIAGFVLAIPAAAGMMILVRTLQGLPVIW